MGAIVLEAIYIFVKQCLLYLLFLPLGIIFAGYLIYILVSVVKEVVEMRQSDIRRQDAYNAERKIYEKKNDCGSALNHDDGDTCDEGHGYRGDTKQQSSCSSE